AWLADIGEFYWFAFAGSDTTRWFRLTDKEYLADGWIAYSWTRVLDSDDPTPLIWVDQEETGDPDNFPVYEVNNIDLPVSASPTDQTVPDDDHPPIVKAWKGEGDYWLCDMTPRWEFCRKTGTNTGKLLRYDQDSDTVVDVEDIILVDLNQL